MAKVDVKTVEKLLEEIALEDNNIEDMKLQFKSLYPEIKTFYPLDLGAAGNLYGLLQAGSFVNDSEIFERSVYTLFRRIGGRLPYKQYSEVDPDFQMLNALFKYLGFSFQLEESSWKRCCENLKRYYAKESFVVEEELPF